MSVILLSLMASAFFGYKAYENSQEIQKQQKTHSQITESHQRQVELEKQKFVYNVILAVLTAVLGLGVEIAKGIIVNKNPTHTPTNTSQPSTKTPSEISTPNNSPNSNSCLGNDKLKSNWKPGQQHPNHPNVIASNKIGIWIPKTGYEFVTTDNKCDLKVKRKK